MREESFDQEVRSAMNHGPRNLILLLLVASGLAGCGGEDATDTTAAPGAASAAGAAGAGGAQAAGAAGQASGGGGGAAGAPAPKIFADIVVDTNRDGVINPDDPADQDGEDAWDDKRGASFLANLDDDDSDGVRDADDEIVNGPEDEADLARILLRASPDAPDGAAGVFSVDELSAANVRVWKKGADGAWVFLAGSVGACTSTLNCGQQAEGQLSTEEVRAGVELGIEARSFRLSLAKEAWTGEVQLSLALRDAEGNPLATDENPEATDQAKIRVAPWVLFGNLDTFDHFWSDSYYAPLVKGLKVASSGSGVKYTTYKSWNDPWTQDFFQTGWTAIPAPEGAVHGMRVGNARPWGRDDGSQWLPYTWLTKNYLRPDQAILKVYKKANTGDTFDSHGNHDLLPPYTRGDETYPLGRIIIGSGVLKETKEFYAAQQVQAPALVVKTSWLVVGHVDEVLSYVPAQTPRGWKLLVASNTLSRQMLQKLEVDGFGEQTMFAGKKAYNSKDQYVDAEISVANALKHPDIMQWSQEAQVEVDDVLDTVKEAVGLEDDEIIFIPILSEEVGGGKVAWQPGTVNALVMGDHIAMADPFGPRVDGQDVFRKDLEDRLGTPMHKLGSQGQGLVVHFVDDWSYHISLGEVHCATNPEGPPPAKPWWAVVR